MISTKDFSITEVKLRMQECQREKEKALKAGDYPTALRLSKEYELLQQIADVRDINVDDMLKKLPKEQEVDFRNDMMLMLVLSDMIESAATDFAEDVKKLDREITHMEVEEDANRIKEISRKIRKAIDGNNDEESQWFGDMSDDILPLIKNKVKKWTRVRNSYKQTNQQTK